MLRRERIAQLLLVSVSIFLIGAITFPDQMHRTNANSTARDDTLPALDYSVYMPFVLDLHPWSSQMAVETHITLTPGAQLTSRLVELHTGWVRLSGRISWRNLQPNENNPINWALLANFENELRLLKQLGIKPVIVLTDSPYWALSPKARDQFGQPTSCGAIDEQYFDEFASFVVQLVDRYNTPEFDVHDWELGNEPDVDPDLIPADSQFGCWGDIDDPFYGGEHYGEMLKVVAPYIRQADSQAKIWIGGLVLSTPETTDPKLGKPELFLQGILEAGAAPYFDIIGFHGHTQYYGVMIDAELYLSGPWNALGGGVRGKIKYLRDLLASYGADKPLVINEIGIGCKPETYDYCDPPIATFYEYQADMLVRVATRVLSEDVRGFTWYTLEGPGWRFQGLLDGAYNPKKAYIAYQEMNMQISGATYIGPVDYGPGMEAYAFQKGPDEILHIVWAKDNTTWTLSIPTSSFLSARMRLEDSIVNVDPGVPVGSFYEIPVGFTPLFLNISP